MDGLSFVDIFETKGIEYVLVLAFLVAFMLFIKFLNTTPRKVAAAAALQPHKEGFAIANDVYLAPGHSWVTVGSGGMISVGINEFLSRLVGKVDKVEIPVRGAEIKRGEPLFTLYQSGRKLVVPSPMTGTVSKVNSDLLSDTSHLEMLPDEWMLNLKPTALAWELSSLRVGRSASSWISNELERLRDFLASHYGQPSLAGETLYDGGLTTVGSLAQLEDEAWACLIHEFINPDQGQKCNNCGSE
ncbi:MAG TPA: glycine cleavage system protein H [Acidobacteriota bacterium]|nr:glycine cleavage system protein H [Acidobacteriota bacterium]